MAEEKDNGTADATEKHVSYKLTAPLGENAAGDVVQLPEAVGDVLVKAGLAELAGADDMGVDDGGEDMEEQPMIANSIKRLGKRLEKTHAEALAKMTKTKATPVNPSLAPYGVDEPLFNSAGAALAAQIRGMHRKDETLLKKSMAYQQEAARAWNRMGVQCKAILGIGETVNANGGFTVNPEFSPDVYAIEHNQLDLQAQCQVIDAKSNIYNQRYINESSLVNGSIFGGLNMVATAEGASFTSSLPAWQNVAYTLQKEGILVYYTREVLEDTSYPLESELNDYVNKAFLYGINTQIVQGSTLEGLLNAPSLVTVTKSSNDTAFHTTPSTCLTYADLNNIWTQVYPDSQASKKGMWLIHPSLVTSLNQMTYTFSGSSPAWGIQYDAQNGLAGQGATTPYRIFGKPCYAHWACSAPGQAGDIIYVDWNTFVLYRRPFRVEISNDFQFGSDQVAVKFVWRGDCKTRMRNAVTGVNGSQSFSSIVTRSAAGT